MDKRCARPIAQTDGNMTLNYRENTLLHMRSRGTLVLHVSRFAQLAWSLKR